MADNTSGIIEVLRLTQEAAVRDVGKKAATSSGSISKELNELATDMFTTRQAAEVCMRLLAKYVDHRFGTVNWVTGSVPPALTPQWWKQYGSNAIKSFITNEFNQAYRVMKDDEWQKAVRRVAAGLHSMAADTRELDFLAKARQKYNTILEDAEKALKRLDYGILESMSRHAELIAKEIGNQDIEKFSQFLHSAYYQLVNFVQRMDVERRVKFIRPRSLPKSASNQAELNAKTILQNSAKIPIEDRRIWMTLNNAILALFNNSKADLSKLPDMWRAVKPKFEELAKQTGSVTKTPKEEIDPQKKENVYQALQALNKLLYTLNGLKLGEFSQYLKQKKTALEPLRAEVVINWIIEGAEALKVFDETARRIGKQYGAKYAVRFAITKKYADLEPFKSFPEIIATAQKNYLSSSWLMKVYTKITDAKREIVGHIPELEPEITKLASAIWHAQDGFKSLFNKIHDAEKHPNLYVKIEEKKRPDKKPAREKLISKEHVRVLQDLKNMPVDIYIKNLKSLKYYLNIFSRNAHYINNDFFNRNFKLKTLLRNVDFAIEQFMKLKEAIDKHFTSDVSFSEYTVDKARDAYNRRISAISSLDNVLNGNMLNPSNWSAFIRRFDNLTAKLPRTYKFDTAELKRLMPEIFSHVKMMQAAREKIEKFKTLNRNETKPEGYVEEASKEMDAAIRLLEAVRRFSTYSRFNEIESVVRSIDQKANYPLYRAGQEFLFAVRNFQKEMAEYRKQVVQNVRIITSENAKKIPKNKWKSSWPTRKTFSIRFAEDDKQRILRAGRTTKMSTKKYWNEFISEVKRCYRALPPHYRIKRINLLEDLSRRVIESWEALDKIART